MSRTIDTNVSIIRNAIYGAEVREAIASALEGTYDASDSATAHAVRYMSPLASGTDVDTVLDAGYYYTQANRGLVHAPNNNQGKLVCFNNPDASTQAGLVQLWFDVSDGGMFWRMKKNSSTAWTSWTRVADGGDLTALNTSAVTYRAPLAAGTDLNDVTAAGYYYTQAWTSTPLVNAPSTETSAKIVCFNSPDASTQNGLVQLWFDVFNGVFYFRTKRNENTDWTRWRQVLTRPQKASGYAARQIAFMTAMTAKARRIGMSDATVITTPNGAASTHSTARDLLRLVIACASCQNILKVNNMPSYEMTVRDSSTEGYRTETLYSTMLIQEGDTRVYHDGVLDPDTADRHHEPIERNRNQELMNAYYMVLGKTGTNVSENVVVSGGSGLSAPAINLAGMWQDKNGRLLCGVVLGAEDPTNKDTDPDNDHSSNWNKGARFRAMRYLLNIASKVAADPTYTPTASETKLVSDYCLCAIACELPRFDTAALSVDYEPTILYELNADVVCETQSTIKLLTALTFADYAPYIDLDEWHTVNSNEHTSGSGSDVLAVGDSIQIRDALISALLVSLNTSTKIMASVVGEYILDHTL